MPPSGVRTAFLLPGQGAFYAGAGQALSAVRPEICDVLAEMDEPTQRLLGISVSAAVLHAPARGIDEWLAQSPDALQLAIVGIAAATHRALDAEGVVPDVLVGHSLGEIAALVAGGMLTAAEAGEIVCHRILALREARLPESYMLALGTGSDRAGHLLAVAGDDTAGVAAVNSAAQTVVSGPSSTMDTVGRLAGVVQVSGVRLKSPYPFHSPLLSAARHHFHRRIEHLRFRPPTVSVYSPILNRTYEVGDDVATCVALHFVRPVQFKDAIEHLRRTGTGLFVESGPLDALTRLARRILDDSRVVTVAPMPGATDEVAAWRAAVAQLTDRPDRPVEVPPAEPTPALTPPAGETTAAVHEPGAGRAEVLAGLIALYAEALEYPPEVFAPDTDLEAELGVDSVKQTELLARVSAIHALAPRPADFRVGDYGTLGRIADLVLGSGSSSGAAESVAVRAEAAEHEPGAGRAEVLAGLIALYAEALEYPPEVFAPDTDLEAELGVDSVKQTELLARVSAIHALAPRPADFRVGDYGTLGRIADLVATTAPGLVHA